MASIKRTLKKTDLLLIIICVLISVISIFLVKSIANSFLVNKRLFIVQIIASCCGLILALFISSVDYHTISKLYMLYLPIAVFLVVLTFFIGFQRGGADDKAWIMLPFGMSFQPSEILKIAFILSFSLHLSCIYKKINKLKNVILLSIHGFIPIFLIHMQGDDGAALIFAIIFATMLFSAGLSWKYILSAILAVAASCPLLWLVINQDQRNRILVILHPEANPSDIGYQQFHSLISIGNGGLLGKGLNQKYYEFVPEIQNDFIFSFVGQAFGYIGSVVVIILLVAMAIRILSTGLKSTDFLGRFICIGVFSMIFSQIILNIGMNLSVLPVIGITLPLLSAGGTSIISTYIGIGLVLNVYTFNNKSLFYNRLLKY